eukprot:3693738-Pleurochrysis_carterae.AAC.2
MFACLASNLHRANAAASVEPTPSNPLLPLRRIRREELGRATWTLLHTLAANYAETPSSHTRASALALMNALGELYPCAECASHLRRQMARTPVTVDSRSALALWLCEAHNKVNRWQAKPLFACEMDALDARWKDCGCAHGNATGEAR